jgi:hypothetical protein
MGVLLNFSGFDPHRGGPLMMFLSPGRALDLTTILDKLPFGGMAP